MISLFLKKHKEKKNLIYFSFVPRLIAAQNKLSVRQDKREKLIFQKLYFSRKNRERYKTF